MARAYEPIDYKLEARRSNFCTNKTHYKTEFYAEATAVNVLEYEPGTFTIRQCEFCKKEYILTKRKAYGRIKAIPRREDDSTLTGQIVH